MSDVEDLLIRTLADERRAVHAAPDLPAGALTRSRQLRRQRRVALAGGSVALALAGAAGIGLLPPRTEVLQPTKPPVNATPALTPAPTPERTPVASGLPGPSRLTLASFMPRLAAPSVGHGVADRLTGVVTDSRGRPLAQIRVMSGDLAQVITRTDPRGRFSVRCQQGLVFSTYAFGPTPGRSTRQTYESSPGVANAAFRTLDTRSGCGRHLAVTMPAGGVVEGTPDPDHRPKTVYLTRVVGGARNDADGTKRFGWFAASVRGDGTYRVEGLATGRYSIESSYEGFADEATFINVVEGRTSDGSYTYWQDPAICYEQPPSPDCPGSSTASPSPTS